MLAANVAMIVRNTLILALFAPQTLRWGRPALGLMFLVSVILPVVHHTHVAEQMALQMALQLDSPVSLKPVLTFGVVFLGISTAGEVAQRALGHVGFLLVTLVGGVVSSASSVVAAATLAAQGKVQPAVAAYAVVLASMTTLLSNVPAVQIAGRNPSSSMRIALVSGAIILAGLIGLLLELALRGRL